MQNSSVRNYLPGKPYLFSDDNNTSATRSVEDPLQRDRYKSNLYNLPIPSYSEVQGNNGIRSRIHDETIDPKFNQLSQAIHEVEQTQEQDMEIGYEESPQPPSFEGLEQRFIDEIMKLARERSDAEDAEFARHKERILEIDNEYQEKLSALRALQATRREEFLRNELQTRLNRYHESTRSYSPIMKVQDPHVYTSSSTFTTREINSRFHDINEYNYDGDRTLSLSHEVSEYKYDGERTMSLPSGTRSQGSESRVPLPPGRVYNKSSAYH